MSDILPYQYSDIICYAFFWFSNLYVCTGMGGSGFSLGPMAGKLLADQIDQDFYMKEKSNVLVEIEKLTPNRFSEKEQKSSIWA